MPLNWNEIKFFKPEEFACKCPKHRGKPVLDMDEKLILGLERLREILGVPINITSGWRCEEWNRTIGGRPYSFHLLKMAVDFSISPKHKKILKEKIKDKEIFAIDKNLGVEKYIWSLCESIGFSGIGYYHDKNFFHVDTGDRFERWCKKGETYYYIF
jgi:uncharacterized protein YcbK (DUF882 family)